MGKAEVGVYRKDKQHQDWGEQKEDWVCLNSGKDTGRFGLVFEKRHCE